MARIFVPLVAPTDEQRLPIARALAQIGHEVVAARYHNTNAGLAEHVRRERIDAVVLFGNSVFNAMTNYAGRPFMLDLEVPYVTLWDDNPLRYLYYLAPLRTGLHRRLFVIDSGVVAQLRALGFEQADYLPLFYTDPAAFRPLEDSAPPAMGVAFAGAVEAWPSIRQVRNGSPPFRLSFLSQAIGDRFVQKRRAARAYVDVYEHLAGEGLDPWSHEFAYLSNFLTYEQKAIEREQMFEALADEPIHQFGDWGQGLSFPNVVCHGAVKPAELRTVYGRAAVNLCCTQWPRACHQRLFQAAACRAFLLHERRDDVPALFEPGREVVLYDSLEELRDLVRFYQGHEAERRAIAGAAHRRFLADHQPAVFARRIAAALEL